MGTTLDAGFALLRRHPRPLLLPQFLLNVGAALTAVVFTLVGVALIGTVDYTYETVRQSTIFGDSVRESHKVAHFTDGQVGTIVVVAIVGVLVYLAFFLASLVSVVRGAERALAGEERVGLGAAMAQALRSTPKLFGLGVVYAIVWWIALAIGVAIVAVGVQASPAVGVLLGLALLLAAIYVGTRLTLWPIVHLAEGVSFGAFGRAWRITRGRFWAMFGVLLLIGIVVIVISAVVGIVLQLALAGLFAADQTAGLVAVIPYIAISVIVSIVLTATYIAPLVVAHRRLAGIDTADLWDAARGLGQPEPGTAPFTPPGTSTGGAQRPWGEATGGTAGWGASESGHWADPTTRGETPPGDGGADAGAPEAGGAEAGGAEPGAPESGDQRGDWGPPSDDSRD